MGKLLSEARGRSAPLAILAFRFFKAVSFWRLICREARAAGAIFDFGLSVCCALDVNANPTKINDNKAIVFMVYIDFVRDLNDLLGDVLETCHVLTMIYKFESGAIVKSQNAL